MRQVFDLASYVLLLHSFLYCDHHRSIHFLTRIRPHTEQSCYANELNNHTFIGTLSRQWLLNKIVYSYSTNPERSHSQNPNTSLTILYKITNLDIRFGSTLIQIFVHNQLNTICYMVELSSTFWLSTVFKYEMKKKWDFSCNFCL